MVREMAHLENGNSETYYIPERNIATLNCLKEGCRLPGKNSYIYKLIIPIIALILLNECSGYKPIFSTQNLQFKIDSYSIKGNKILGNKLYSKLHNISKSNKNLTKAEVGLSFEKVPCLLCRVKITSATT